MNRYDPILPAGREARIKYLDADYQVVQEGDFVRCAVTGKPVRIADLRYWSVARQEAYCDAAAALKRHLEPAKI